MKRCHYQGCTAEATREAVSACSEHWRLLLCEGHMNLFSALSISEGWRLR